MAHILYTDNHLLVLNKPPGMLTQPNETESPSLEAWGKAWVKEQFHKPGNVFLSAVHRLDRPVSGAVLFARTSKALSRLNLFLRNRRFQKHYLALVEGKVAEEEGVLENELQRLAHRAQIVEEKSATTKSCLLRYQRLKYIQGNTLLRIFLVTGRYHQIRAQFATLGHPIVGDHKYGSQVVCEQIFLHHEELHFPHPITEQLLECKAPFPPHWQKIR